LGRSGRCGLKPRCGRRKVGRSRHRHVLDRRFVVQDADVLARSGVGKQGDAVTSLMARDGADREPRRKQAAIARTRDLLDGQGGHAAGALPAVREHQTSQHPDRNNKPREISSRGLLTVSSPPHTGHVTGSRGHSGTRPTPITRCRDGSHPSRDGRLRGGHGGPAQLYPPHQGWDMVGSWTRISGRW